MTDIGHSFGSVPKVLSSMFTVPLPRQGPEWRNELTGRPITTEIYRNISVVMAGRGQRILITDL